MENGKFGKSSPPCAISLVKAIVQMAPLTKRLLSLTHPVCTFEFSAKNAKITIFVIIFFQGPLPGTSSRDLFQGPLPGTSGRVCMCVTQALGRALDQSGSGIFFRGGRCA